MNEPSPTVRGGSARSRSFNVRFVDALNRILVKLRVEEVPHIRRIIITVVGGTILVLGAALVFLPGPGALVILGGLAILGTEYAWARRWMRKGKLMAKRALSQTQKILSPTPAEEPPPEPDTAAVAPPPKPAGSVPPAKTTLVH